MALFFVMVFVLVFGFLWQFLQVWLFVVALIAGCVLDDQECTFWAESEARFALNLVMISEVT